MATKYTSRHRHDCRHSLMVYLDMRIAAISCSEAWWRLIAAAASDAGRAYSLVVYLDMRIAAISCSEAWWRLLVAAASDAGRAYSLVVYLDMRIAAISCSEAWWRLLAAAASDAGRARAVYAPEAVWVARGGGTARTRHDVCQRLAQSAQQLPRPSLPGQRPAQNTQRSQTYQPSKWPI